LSTHSQPQVHLSAGFWRTTAVLTILNLLALWWEWTHPLSAFLPEAARPADEIDGLFLFMTLVGTAIFIYVVGYLVYFAIAFRARRDDPENAIGLQLHDATALEIWWTVIPTILVIILGVWSTMTWARLQSQPGGAFTMEAIGHQWNFEFRYPGLNKTIWNEMHVPIDKPITMHVSSADVLHSFWVPEGRLKVDMVPGLINTIRFTPTRIGTYRIICAEYCGFSHGKMIASYVVQSQADFDKWYNEQKNGAPQNSGGPGAGAAAAALPPSTGGDAAAGKALFDTKCVACHTTGAFDDRKVGPGLGNVLHDAAHPDLVTGKPATPGNVADILKNGAQGSIGVMPNEQMNGLNDKDIANLVAYLSSLGSK